MSKFATVQMAVLLKVIRITAQVVLSLVLIWILVYHIKSVLTKKSSALDSATRKADTANQVIFILFWSSDNPQYAHFEEGQAMFLKNKCSSVNCYVTRNKNLLDGDYRNFNVIVLGNNDLNDAPELRTNQQRYIFASKESSEKNPICDIRYNNFFNLTFTYKLDSDVVWSYFTVFDNRGPEVAPRLNVDWIEGPANISKVVMKKIAAKLYTAIYFMRACVVDYKQLSMITKIQHALRKFYIDVKIVNACPENCGRPEKCCIEEDLSKYYFYFVYEDVTAEDYVTDEVLNAINNYAVPVMFGSTDYSRFLPPNSYVDAGRMKPHQIAMTIAQLIATPSEYAKYFHWRSVYTVSPYTNSVCKLCELLNEDTRSVYGNFGRWWNPKGYVCKYPVDESLNMV